ncbi:MAG: ribonuclease III [Pseudomonadota bacterium]
MPPDSQTIRGLAERFRDPRLLDQALTHRSAGNRNNERLEFLGDGILNFVIAAELFARRPEADEGDLSRLRATLVRKETLAEVARELGLGDALKLGQGEMRSGGFRRASILADALEAVLGALYIDSGFDGCADVIRDWFAKRLDHLPAAAALKDAKTRLQEYLQARQIPLPEYDLDRTEGADHARIFHVVVRIPDRGIELAASGSSRRKAEQAAAALALEAVEDA